MRFIVRHKMKTLHIALFALISAGGAFGDPAPSQDEARQLLELDAGMEEYPGSIYAQARHDGIDYRPILRKAITLDPTALSKLFKMRFAGEGGETHCANLLNLMPLWGDADFAKRLSTEEPWIRNLVVDNIEYAWGRPEWDRFPLTKALKSTAPEDQHQGEQAVFGVSQIFHRFPSSAAGVPPLSAPCPAVGRFLDFLVLRAR